MLSGMVFVSTPYIKVSVSYDCTSHINHCRKVYKANVYCFFCYLALQLEKYLQYSVDITTEQSFRYMELTDAKILISKNVSLYWVRKLGHICYNTQRSEPL